MGLQVRIMQGIERADSCSCLPTAAVCQAAPVHDPFTVAMERMKRIESSLLQLVLMEINIYL